MKDSERAAIAIPDVMIGYTMNQNTVKILRERVINQMINIRIELAEHSCLRCKKHRKK